MSDGIRVYLTNDLLFSSQILSAAQNAQKPLEWSSSPQDFSEKIQAGNVRLALLDLGTVTGAISELISELRTGNPECKVVAYGPHVHVDRLIEAQKAGCDEVLARGAFSREITRLLATYG